MTRRFKIARRQQQQQQPQQHQQPSRLKTPGGGSPSEPTRPMAWPTSRRTPAAAIDQAERSIAQSRLTHASYESRATADLPADFRLGWGIHLLQYTQQQLSVIERPVVTRFDKQLRIWMMWARLAQRLCRFTVFQVRIILGLAWRSCEELPRPFVQIGARAPPG